MIALPANLIILELANNHMGSLEHGQRIISEYSSLIEEFPNFNFCFKLQYRHLDTFIRPDFKGRSDIKHIKRFEETRLSRQDQKKIVSTIKKHGFLAMCTPFDEASVSEIIEDGFDIIKVASCSFGDWPLIEVVSKTSLPIVASTAGATLQTIDDTISFFENRNKDFIIQHCIGEYPTPNAQMNLNQIDFLKHRHPNVRFGFSTHEDPQDTSIVRMAIAKGAVSLERHVGLQTNDYKLNAYSSTLDQIRAWLKAAHSSLEACGKMFERYTPSKTEEESLISLQRGVFAKSSISKGQKIKIDDVVFAFPPSPGQLTANIFSKYTSIIALKAFPKDAEISENAVEILNGKALVLSHAEKVMNLLNDSAAVLPKKFELELSHHYGLEKFLEYGLSMITLINREYCKKILVCLPNQRHPEQYHKIKEETFNILHGNLEVKIDGKRRYLDEGEVVTILPGQKHEFVSEAGAVIEELSSTHLPDDSYYTDEKIHLNVSRKSLVKWVN